MRQILCTTDGGSNRTHFRPYLYSPVVSVCLALLLVVRARADEKTMASGGNRRKKADDRLSTLPLPVLHRILTFLPTKHAVQTCILSKRWEDLWASVPALDLDDDLFPYAFPCKEKKKPQSDGHREAEAALSKETTTLPDFVYRVMALRYGSNLQGFRLLLHNNYWAPCVDTWLCYAVRHSVQKVEISFCSEQRYRLPRWLLRCSSLQDMKLDLQNSLVDLPSCISLPNLESLKLAHLRVNAGSSVQQLLCGCPKLKVFTMRSCWLPKANAFDVSSCSCLESLSLEGNQLLVMNIINFSAPKLKSLAIENSIRMFSGSLAISAPNLLYLKYIDDILGEFRINLPMLLDAVVFWNASCSLSELEAESRVRFLRGLKHARTLRFCASYIENLSRIMDLLICKSCSFSNLKHLELKISGHYHDVVCFLLCCPSIETLVIEMTNRNGGGNSAGNDFPCGYSLHDLKEVEIRWFGETDTVVNLMKFLLKSALVLEKMIVNNPTVKLDQQKQKEISQKLLTCPRASTRMLVLFF
ncbi:hypothetical protein ACLOJK_020456 [Asimina triloba]